MAAANRHMLTLPARVAHLWLVQPEAIQAPTVLARYHALLSEDEKARHARFAFASDRHRYLVTRALVRTTLSAYADVPPHAWCFATNAHGRPRVDQPAAPAGLDFNVSHTKGLVVCLIGRDVPLGVDVEHIDRRTDIAAVAPRFFSREEACSLAELPAAAQRERFFQYWTLKEAYIKARGVGLALPLSQFTFHLQQHCPAVRISFGPQIDDAPEAWQFVRLQPTATHRIAAAFRRGAGPDIQVDVRHIVPWPRD